MTLDPQKLRQHLANICDKYCQAAKHLETLRLHQAELERAGMYPAVPTERWKDERYLYLYFRDAPPGLVLDAKQRLYIGSDPARIAAARRLAERRQQWETLDQTAKSLAWWLQNKERAIMDLARDSERWPRSEVPVLSSGAELGPPALADVGPARPNDLGLDIAGQPGAISPNDLGAENAGDSGVAGPNKECDAYR